jgi:CheY-like chemotaxis protein
MYCDYLASDSETRFALEVCPGAQAFERASAILPDVVVTDLVLDRRADGGIDLLLRLRHAPRTKDIGIIVVTGWASRVDHARAREAGCDILLTKPCELSELLAAVSRVCVERSA